MDVTNKPARVPGNRKRAFEFRGGVRIAGTILACDAAAGRDLVFVSHAAAIGARARRAWPRLGGARRQILATETTLALLGDLGRRLRRHALVAAYGRPFALGSLRIEIFPSGYLPGAASLLCEHDGRRVVYTGALGDEAEVRAADAVCLDARFAARAFAFPPRAEAEAALRAAVRSEAAAGAPVLLIDPSVLPLAPRLGALLAADGFALRAPRAIVELAAAYRRAELDAPAMQRFAGRLAPNEVLLWPAGARAPGRIGVGGLRPPRPNHPVSPMRPIRLIRLICVGPQADDPLARARLGAGCGVVLAAEAGFPALVRYLEATGASEVALLGAPGDELVEELRGRGLDAYRLGPPRQIDLFPRVEQSSAAP